jgi:predicted methyltransferase MtxX (methanogen marker protein 4)
MANWISDEPIEGADQDVLDRRVLAHAIATEIVAIGKEAYELEQVETGLIDELEEIQTVHDRDRSEELREKLRALSVKQAMRLTGPSRRQLFYLRSGQGRLTPGRLSALEREALLAPFSTTPASLRQPD